MKLITRTRSFVYPAVLIILGLSITLHAADMSVTARENRDRLIKTNECVDCNLQNADLNRLLLSGADLSGADLTGATFFLSDLSGANLTKTILRDTRFGGADLADADLRGADLRGASLSGAYLGGSLMDGSFVAVPISDEASLAEIKEKVYIPDDSTPKAPQEKKQVSIGKRKDFGSVPPQISRSTKDVDHPAPGRSIHPQVVPNSDAPEIKTVTPVNEITINEKAIEGSGTEVVLAQQLNTQKSSLEPEPADKSEVLNKTVRSEIKRNTVQGPKKSLEKNRDPKSSITIKDTTEDLITESAIAEETEIDADPEKNVTAVDENAEKSTYSGNQAEEILKTVPEISDEKRILMQSVVKNKKCYQCDLAGADLAEKSFKGGDLEGTIFDNANLVSVNFEKANLKGVSFKNANLANAKFKRADLYKADFKGAELSGADFSDALVDDANFKGATGYIFSPLDDEKK